MFSQRDLSLWRKPRPPNSQEQLAQYIQEGQNSILAVVKNEEPTQFVFQAAQW